MPNSRSKSTSRHPTVRVEHALAGDLYEHLSSLEVALHRMVRARLEREFGEGEKGWWREGLPENIRTACAARREQDDDPCEEPYGYTNLIDLKSVISKNWHLFHPELPKPYGADKKKLETDFVRLNGIRNAVMHPVKQKKWTQNDLEFVRQMRGLFQPQISKRPSAPACN